MSDQLAALAAEVARFQAWAENYPVAERGGEWECGYEGWQPLYDTFIAVVQSSSCNQWSDATKAMLLYVIARDNETGYLVEKVAEDPDRLLCLAEHALVAADSDAKWQFAVELGNLNTRISEVEPLLLRFMDDADEYVRRRTLSALADIGSTHTAALAERAWNTGNEYQRMMALYALEKVHSPLLETYLSRAEADGRQYLVNTAAMIRAGDSD
jgi:hypothetical protein